MNTVYDFAQQRKAEKERLKKHDITLLAVNWSDTLPYSQTVQVHGVTTTNIVFIAPEPAQENIDTVGNCKIVATEQGANTITFTALDTKPDININFHVLVGGEG